MRRTLEERIQSIQQQDIDLAPLLDVVFILLIFFIVSTVFVKETGVDIDKPQAVSTQSLDRSTIMLAITHDKKVMYDSTNIGVAGVRHTIFQAIRNQDRPIVIQADKTVTTELLVEVIDQAKLAGAKTVNVATSIP